MFTRLFTAFGAFLLIAQPAFAQDTATHNKQTELVKGLRVTVEGCVAEGLKANTYLLSTVKELDGPPVETGRKRVYWLDSPKHVEDHVGRLVQISGTIFDLERSEIDVDSTGPDGEALATIEGPGLGEVQVRQPVTIGALVGTVPASPQDQDLPITLVKIKVANVKVMSVCGRVPATAVRPPG